MSQELDVGNQRFGTYFSNLLWKAEEPVNKSQDIQSIFFRGKDTSSAHTPSRIRTFTQAGEQHKKARKESAMTQVTTRNGPRSPASSHPLGLP